ncbi:MAG: cyclic nucleotide-binding domain-containing protein [Kiritimatiellia bacterium]
MFRKFINPGRLLRGTAITVDDCGVSRAALLLALRRTELFCRMPDALADLLLQTMAGRRVREGAYLFREGDRGDSLLLKGDGVACVTQLRPGMMDARTLARLTEPCVLGQEAFYGVEKRSVTVRMLSEGSVFHIRLGVFADLVANDFVTWCEADAVPVDAHLLWIGDSRRRPRGLAGMPCVTIDCLKRYVREAPAGDATYCCAKDDTIAALASFLLAQSGLKALAVRQGRKLSRGSA